LIKWTRSFGGGEQGGDATLAKETRVTSFKETAPKKLLQRVLKSKSGTSQLHLTKFHNFSRRGGGRLWADNCRLPHPLMIKRGAYARKGGEERGKRK